MLADSKSLQDRIVADVKTGSATFNNVLLPFALDDNKMSLEAHIIGFYSAVSTDEKLRDASTEAEKKMEDFGIDSSMREDIFQLVDEVFKNQKDDRKLDAESRRLLEKDHKGYIRMGLGIPAGPDRDRFKAIKKRLSELSIAFQKNLNEEKGGLWVQPKELDGVPEDVVGGLKEGEEGSENEGKLFLTFKYPDLFPVQKYCKKCRHEIQALHCQREQVQPKRGAFQRGDRVTRRSGEDSRLSKPRHFPDRRQDGKDPEDCRRLPWRPARETCAWWTERNRDFEEAQEE